MIRPKSTTLVATLTSSMLACVLFAVAGCEGGGSSATPEGGAGAATKTTDANPKKADAQPIKKGVDFSEGIPKK